MFFDKDKRQRSVQELAAIDKDGLEYSVFLEKNTHTHSSSRA